MDPNVIKRISKERKSQEETNIKTLKMVAPETEFQKPTDHRIRKNSREELMNKVKSKSTAS